MSARVYTGAATPTTLSGSITNISTSGTITTTTNWLTSGQFSIVVDPGLAGEEKILCTLSGTTLTFVTRGYDGTTAASHNSGAVVYPVPTAIDFSEANTHVNASSAVHGLAGSVVGTTDTQTLTNKDLSSSTNTFPASTPAGKNAVINGGMDFWQRGTSIAVAASSTNSYTADRFCLSNSANEVSTVSQQLTSDTTNLPNIKYCARVQRNSGQTGTSPILFEQSIETLNSIPLVGKIVTLSFYARAGSNFSAGSNSVGAQIITGTGTDQNLNSVTGASILSSTGNILSTTFQRFTATTTIPTTATQVFLRFLFTPTGTAGANDYFEITGVQLELGSTATTFSRAGGSIGGELALCQRYYQKSYPQGTTVPTNSTSAGVVFVPGSSVASTAYFAQVFLLITMRTAPTVTIYSYVSSTVSVVSSANGADLAASSGVANLIGDRGFTVQNSSGGTITAGAGGFDFHYAASAEL